MKSRRNKAIFKSLGYIKRENGIYSKILDCYNCNGYLNVIRMGDVEECNVCEDGKIEEFAWTEKQEKEWNKKYSEDGFCEII